MLKGLVCAVGLWVGLVSAAVAQVQVDHAWARATVAGQKGTGAFMTITAPAGARLLGGASPVAGVVEIHEMAIDGNVMRMRALPKGLELPAGKAVGLKPGGYHVMLMDLKEPLNDGAKLKLELKLEGKDGKPFTQPLELDVRQAPPSAMKH